MISSNYLTSVVLFQCIVLCGNTQPSDTRSRLEQIAAAAADDENPLNSNYGVLMILNCSESLDSHLCGECVSRGSLRPLKPVNTSLCNFKKVTCHAFYT